LYKASSIVAIVLGVTLCSAGPSHAGDVKVAQQTESQSGSEAPAPAKGDGPNLAVGESAKEGREHGDDSADSACIGQLAAAEEAFQNKIDANAWSEADAEKVNELLDEADAFCTEGNLKDARATLDTVNSLVANAK
jgi:hypothetical protein